ITRFELIIIPRSLLVVEYHIAALINIKVHHPVLGPSHQTVDVTFFSGRTLIIDHNILADLVALDIFACPISFEG
ncbi:hypothetical protein BpHYR1_031474, partial [Brachionus plicatilis]